MGYLEALRQSGTGVGDSGLPMTRPKNFNYSKYSRGQKFFQDNVFSCAYAMLTSLVCGLSVENLLLPLVFTNQSDKPLKALRRYLRTFQHVAKWHFYDIFDEESSAYRSLCSVRRQHIFVRDAMISSGSDVDTKKLNYVSQYDMSLVQSGFIGAIIMYPQECGIQCTEEDLECFVYFWYCVGHMLGIADENNICKEGYHTAWKICKEIETDILTPALFDPPSQFEPMAQALIDGMNHMLRFPLHSLNAFIAATPSMVASSRSSLTIIDHLRVMFLRILMKMVRYFPRLRSVLNKSLIPLMSADIPSSGPSDS